MSDSQQSVSVGFHAKLLAGEGISSDPQAESGFPVHILHTDGRAKTSSHVNVTGGCAEVAEWLKLSCLSVSPSLPFIGFSNSA